MADSTEKGTAVVPPYVSYAVVKKVIDRLLDEGPPAIVDRSYLTGMSNGYKTQVLGALRALGLILENGAPSASLEEIIAGETDYATFLHTEMRHLYPSAIKLAEVNGTTAQLEKAFHDDFGISGSTLQGAIRFYIEASKVAGLPLSPHFRTPPRKTAKVTIKKASGRAQVAKRPNASSVTETSSQSTSAPPAGTTSRCSLAGL